MREFIPKAGTPLWPFRNPVTRSTGSPSPSDGIPNNDLRMPHDAVPYSGASHAQLFLNLQLARWVSVPLPFHMDRIAESYDGGFSHDAGRDGTGVCRNGRLNLNRTYVYFFGGGKADGNGKMKDVLGGKGAGLAEMTNAGLPVPPGFTIQTEACREYMRGALSPQIDSRDARRPRTAREAAGAKAGRGRKSAAGLRPLRRQVLHARHDGHHSQPGPERSGRRGAGQAQQ